MAETPAERAKARALRLLEKRDYSEAELAAKLVEKGEEPEAAEQAAERMAELGCAVAKRDVYETLELREPEAGEDTVELSASAMGTAPMSFANSQSGEGEIDAMLDELAAAKTKDIEPLLKRFGELGKITDAEKYADALQSLYDDVLKLSNGGENEAKAMEKILRESIENGKN